MINEDDMSGHITCMEEKRNVYRDHLEDLGIFGRIILKWILMKWGRDWICVGQDRDIVGSFEHSDEHSCSVKDGKFLD
jgi:hypothetical protein